MAAHKKATAVVPGTVVRDTPMVDEVVAMEAHRQSELAVGEDLAAKQAAGRVSLA